MAKRNGILLAGAAGFIGSRLSRMLINGTAPVIGIDALTYAGHYSRLPVDFSPDLFVEGDISNFDLITELLQKYRIGTIINAAAESHVDKSICEPDAFVHTNVVGTYKLLEASLGYWKMLPPKEQASFRFLQISTDEVFGSIEVGQSARESSVYAPNSPYSASKAAADHFVRAWYKTYGLPTLVTHCSNNYGPYQHPEKLIPMTIANAIAGRPIPIYGDGMNVRDWLHVDDHCTALQLVLESGTVGETYNLGGDCNRTNLEVVELICQTVERLMPNLEHSCLDLIQFVEDRPGHDQRYSIDASKIKSELGWRPKIDLGNGINTTVRWYINNQEWVEDMLARI